MDKIRVTAYFHKRDVEPPPGELPTEGAFPIIEAIEGIPSSGVLSLVDGYYILDAEGASKIPGNRAFSAAKVLIVYVDTQAEALQVKDAIMNMAADGQTIGFEMAEVSVYTFTKE